MMQTVGFDKCGREFASGGNTKGITAYNNCPTRLSKGDIVLLSFSGTSGREVYADFPTTLDITACVFHHTGIVYDDYINAGSIGRFVIQGECYAMVDGTTDIAAGYSLEVLNQVAFDGTVTNVAFVAGSGTTKDTITDNDSGLVTDGFLKGGKISIYGATTSGNNITHELNTVAAGTLTLETIGALTAEAGVTGLTIEQFGWLTYDATAQSVKTCAIALEAYTTNEIGLVKVYKPGFPHTIAAS